VEAQLPQATIGWTKVRARAGGIVWWGGGNDRAIGQASSVLFVTEVREVAIGLA